MYDNRSIIIINLTTMRVNKNKLVYKSGITDQPERNKRKRK